MLQDDTCYVRQAMNGPESLGYTDQCHLPVSCECQGSGSMFQHRIVPHNKTSLRESHRLLLQVFAFISKPIHGNCHATHIVTALFMTWP